MPPPAENSAMSTPWKACGVNSSMKIRSPRKSMVLPAERALASALSLPTRKLRLSMVAMNSAPTAPVTPTMATTGSYVTWFVLSVYGQQKSPGPFQAGLRFRLMRSFDYARTAPEPPEGSLVLAVRLVVAFMGRSYEGDRARRQRLLGGKCA